MRPLVALCVVRAACLEGASALDAAGLLAASPAQAFSVQLLPWMQHGINQADVGHGQPPLVQTF
eukprot:COSAG05_NODE_17712_length_320_cov_1.072398_1_plen_63_part_10